MYYSTESLEVIKSQPRKCFLTVRQISEWQPLLHFENKGPECNLAQSVAYVVTCWNPEKKKA